jgi:hypothetical protein
MPFQAAFRNLKTFTVGKFYTSSHETMMTASQAVDYEAIALYGL